MAVARVVIVEDHALVRTGLRTLLLANGFEVVGDAADGVIGRELIWEVRPDVAIIDLGIPGKDGLTLTRELKTVPFSPHVVILTMKEDESAVLEALRAGADAYCVKASGPEVVVDAVRTVAAGGAYFDPRVAFAVLARFNGNRTEAASSPLTARETEILGLIADGSSNTEIAERLFVGLGTVKAHVAEILRKLSAIDRAHASAIALRSGFIS